MQQDKTRRLLILQGGCTPDDKRGEQRSGNALKPSEVMSVMEHISLFPIKQKRYGTREHNYLNAELNVKIMYSLFLEKHPESKVKYEYYKKVFRENFNLSFGRLQVDVCNDCETLSLKLKNKFLNNTAKRVAAAGLLVYKRRSKKFYNALKASKELCRTQNNTAAISFDFVQNLQLPRCPAQDLFYLSQLTINVRDSSKGVIVGKDLIEGATTNTFPLLLPGVITTEMLVDLAIPNGKVPISTKKRSYQKVLHICG
ncbi:hypothetical protein ILUMI_25851 [Ignelater luminosus]|uniref:Uncharacterized protein n=1 Tax=Ignelater luminosus TaxID=2038154 RepID=A0A8K0C943_IGNLU|nr:hypothetical protein ILUMI_25851 [Ignelater luminosus]